MVWCPTVDITLSQASIKLEYSTLPLALSVQLEIPEDGSIVYFNNRTTDNLPTGLVGEAVWEEFLEPG